MADPLLGERLDRRGDGTSEAAALVAASDRQRLRACAAVDAVLPGFEAAERTSRVGLETPTVLTVAPGALDDEVVVAAIDHRLGRGDLGQDRGMVVDPDVNRGHPVAPALRTPRPGPSTPVNIDPFFGADALRHQHTLVLNDAQPALGRAVEDLCDALATAFRSHVQVNVYASFGDATGFGPHWDDHDVIVVPVAGRKYWEVRAPTELGPIAGFTAKGGDGEAVWSGVLEPGRALAIPRGWPHEVHGIDGEASIHLTFSNRRALGTDVFANIEPQTVGPGWRLSEADLEHAFGRWYSGLVPFPRHGPLEVLAAAEAHWQDHDLHLALLGGIVFCPERCSPRQVCLRAADRWLTIERSSTPALVHALDHPWWQVDDLTATGLHRAGALDLVERLGRAGVLQLRRRR